MTERENILIDALISAGHIAEQARTAMEKFKAENTELRHRAEVAERALENACVVILSSRNGDQPRRLRAYYKAYFEAAEKELAEEGEDD